MGVTVALREMDVARVSSAWLYEVANHRTGQLAHTPTSPPEGGSGQFGQIHFQLWDRTHEKRLVLGV